MSKVDVIILPREGFIQLVPFGSRFVGCTKSDSDHDYLVLVKKRPKEGDKIVEGYTPDVEDPLYGTFFSSWRKDNVNLVFTDSKGFFDATIEARDFCKKYKVFDKGDRCRVHESFRAHLEYWEI